MIIVDLDQNSPEWEMEKLGKPSASNCSKIICNDGKPSKQRDGYLYELAAEIVTGQKANGYKNGFMEEGQNREQEACDLFCMLNNVEARKVGVVYKDEAKRFLCSPDRLIGTKHGLECKNPLPKTQVGYLLKNELPSEYFGQIQFSLYITGFDAWHFFSYVPCMKPLHVRVKRDEAFLKALDLELTKFCNELDEVVKKIR